MKKPSRKVITIITTISLVLLSALAIFLLILEHNWRVREKQRVELLETVVPQLEEIHNKNHPYLTMLETEAEWEDGKLLLIHKIEVPTSLVSTVNSIIDSNFCRKNPGFRDAMIECLVYDLEYVCYTYYQEIETDINYVFTTQLISKDGKLLFWVNGDCVIYTVVPYADDKNLGGIDYLNSQEDVYTAPEYQPITLFEE